MKTKDREKIYLSENVWQSITWLIWFVVMFCFHKIIPYTTEIDYDDRNYGIFSISYWQGQGHLLIMVLASIPLMYLVWKIMNYFFELEGAD